MNILQILPGLNTGGVETGTADLAKELVRNGHKAVVVSCGGKLVDRLVASGAIHYQLPVDKKSPLAIISMIKAIVKVIEKEEINIVHARSRVPAISGFFAAHIKGVPFITTCHGYYSRHIFSRVMGWGKFVIVSSNIIAKHMVKDFAVPIERIRLIPRGVDIEKFTYNPPRTGKIEEYTIGIIGRITPIKGHICLIRAMAKVTRFMPNVKLLIIGDAPADKPQYRQELETLVKRLSLSKYIHFLGERHDIPAQVSRLDLVVMPSVGEEAFGRSIIEAAACGVPVIATKVGGIVDIIKDGENGLLVLPNDYNGLADAIMKVLKDDSLKARLSKAARSSVERHFSLTQMYENTLKVYHEAMNSFKILIIKWSALGDIILSIPALKAIKQKFPKASIAMLTSSAGSQMLGIYPYVKEFIIYNSAKAGLDSIKQILAVSSELRKASIDLVIDLQNNKKSRILSFLSFAPRRLGYKTKKFDFLLNETADGARLAIPPVEHQFNLLKKIGIESIPEAEFMISDKDMNFAENIITDGWVGRSQMLVGINCGASVRWQTKRWLTQRWAKLCDMLAEKGLRVVLCGAKSDLESARKITSTMKAKPINLVGKTTMMQLAAIIKNCSVFVSPDSASAHIAWLLKVPCVVLFGPTDPKRHLQPSAINRIIYKQLKCSPCYKPRCRNNRCLADITSEEVFASVSELLGGKKA